MTAPAENECICPYTDPSTWLSAASCGYGSGYEPGSIQEWNPDCPAHPAESSWLDVAAKVEAEQPPPFAPPYNDGCDCTELCAMGPTCPGGSLAGLPGSGCWRSSAPDLCACNPIDGEDPRCEIHGSPMTTTTTPDPAPREVGRARREGDPA